MGCTTTSEFVLGERECTKFNASTGFSKVKLPELYGCVNGAIADLSKHENKEHKISTELNAYEKIVFTRFSQKFEEKELTKQDIALIIKKFELNELHSFFSEIYSAKTFLLHALILTCDSIENKIGLLYRIAEADGGANNKLSKDSVVIVLKLIAEIALEIIPKFCSEKLPSDCPAKVEFAELSAAYFDLKSKLVDDIAKKFEESEVTIGKLFEVLNGSKFIFNGAELREKMISDYKGSKKPMIAIEQPNDTEMTKTAQPPKDLFDIPEPDSTAHKEEVKID